MLTSVGFRLKEERERLGMKSAASFAEQADVSRTTQFYFEKNERAPDSSYLARIAEMGVDVLYVVTGQRTGDPEPLTRDEVALLDNYRHSPKEGKQAIQTTSSAFAQQKGLTKKGVA